MGWHDTVAAKAAAAGRSAGEFKAGARRKAQATCLFLLVAAGVWYFAGWPWALIPAAVAALSACQSVSATMIAARLRS